MLYVYCGSGEEGARAKVRATVAAMRTKNPEATYVRVTADMISEAYLQELVQSQGLFKQSYIVLFDHCFASAESKDLLMAARKEIATAPHVFFILEGALTKADQKKLDTHAEKVNLYQEKEVAARNSSFNIFSLTDALAARDKKELWVLYMRAKQNGSSDEEIVGILFWMLKGMMLARKTRTPDEAGMKPYPYKKAQNGAQNFSVQELQYMLESLSIVLPQSRRSAAPEGTALEKWILSI